MNNLSWIYHLPAIEAPSRILLLPIIGISQLISSASDLQLVMTKNLAINLKNPSVWTLINICLSLNLVYILCYLNETAYQFV